jgi:hypothetical protein
MGSLSSSTVASVAPLKGGATLRYACVPVTGRSNCYANATLHRTELTDIG